jgi:hypothetical protein
MRTIDAEKPKKIRPCMTAKHRYDNILRDPVGEARAIHMASFSSPFKESPRKGGKTVVSGKGELIVIEGMDGSGKTVLSEKIRKTFPKFEYIHPVPSHGPEGMDGEYMVQGMRDLFAKVRGGQLFVTDRINLISEVIYGPTCRGVSKLSPFDFARCLAEFLALQPIVIFCNPSYKAIEENIKKTFQMEGVSSNIIKLYRDYCMWIDVWRNSFGAIEYNYLRDPQATMPLMYIQMLMVEGGIKANE